jgi:FG-GAP repeat protein
VLVSALLVGPSHVAHAKTKAPVSDFDADGFADLVIGAPGEAVGGVARAGLVSLLYSSKTGPVASSNDSWDRASEGIEGGPHTDASLGVALASGDFDDDGYDDLAVGAPGDTVGGHREAGSVTVIDGSEHGLGGGGDRLLTQNTSLIGGDAEPLDHFGAALAAGDFDGDGFDDLAIGAPNETLKDKTEKKDAGNVTILYGSGSGLRGTGSQQFSQGTAGLFGDIESGDRFGNALASGNVNDDDFDDLAIGVPGEDIGPKGSSGAVAVLLGTSRRLVPTTDSQAFTQADKGVPGVSESGDRFGEALAVGDIDEDGNDDLIVGAPGEMVGAATSAGAITILFGSDDGTSTTGAQLITQATKGVPSEVERNDRFGEAIAAGDVDGDGADEVVVGAPGESAGGRLGAGSATVLRGTKEGVSTSGVRLLYEGMNGVPGSPGTDEFFGNAVRVIDTNDDDRGEVVIGAPGEVVGPHRDGGTITILRGTRDGLSKSGVRVISQDTASIEGDTEDGDLFGFTLG